MYTHNTYTNMYPHTQHTLNNTIHYFDFSTEFFSYHLFGKYQLGKMFVTLKILK